MDELRGIVDEGVPVTRDTIEKAVEQIAISCCRGPVQVATVLELIESGKVERTLYRIPGRGLDNALLLGSARLDNSSWRNLKKRMSVAGFRFKTVHPDRPEPGKDGHVVAYWTPLDPPSR